MDIDDVRNALVRRTELPGKRDLVDLYADANQDLKRQVIASRVDAMHESIDRALAAGGAIYVRPAGADYIEHVDPFADMQTPSAISESTKYPLLPGPDSTETGRDHRRGVIEP